MKRKWIALYFTGTHVVQGRLIYADSYSEAYAIGTRRALRRGDDLDYIELNSILKDILKDRVSFDFDGTLEFQHTQDYAKELIEKGVEVCANHLITQNIFAFFFPL